jgi:hypothetical protein
VPESEEACDHPVIVAAERFHATIKGRNVRSKFFLRKRIEAGQTTLVGWWGKPLGRSFASLCGYTVAAVRKYLWARVHKCLEMDTARMIN